MTRKLKPSQVRVGMKFGRLAVTKLHWEEKPCLSRKSGFRTYLMIDARCECGNEKLGIYSHALTHGDTNSCGCFQKESSIENHTTHGMYGHPICDAIKSMNARCKNPDHKVWKDYGGRGIRIEHRPWNRDANPDGFVQSFIDWNASLPEEKQWHPGLMIDRIDNDKGYSPSNCKWSNDRQSQRNKRDTIMRRFRGSEIPLADIYDTLKAEGHILNEITYERFRQRTTKLGWTLWQACKTPLHSVVK